MACVDDNVLVQLVEGTLDNDAAKEVLRHADECDSCRRVISQLANDSAVASQVLETAGNRSALLTFTPDAGFIVESENLALSVAPGTRVDHYAIESVIGYGGMGQVFLARDQRLERHVAVKIVHAGLIEQPGVVQRFLFEARATAKFSHPNIVTVFDVGEYRGCPYVALEYVDGVTLARLLADGPLSLSKTIAIGSAVASALLEAHRHGILHRDLKPANVMIPSDGRVRVLDFGLAQALRSEGVIAPPAIDSSSNHSEAQATLGVLGTPAYMSPEQWRCEPSSPAVDIWALGLVLFEMATGQRLFSGPGLLALRKQIVDDAWTPLPALAAWPPAFSDLVVRCLDKDPAARPTAQKAVDALQRLQDETSRPAALSASAGISRLHHRRPEITLFFIGVVVLAMVIGAWSVIRYANRPQPMRPLAHATHDGSANSVAPIVDASPVVDDAHSVDAHSTDASVGRSTFDAAINGQHSDHGRRPSRRLRRKHRRRKPTTSLQKGGQLIVSVTADGKLSWADVYVDGKFRGQTPLRLDGIRAGRHVLEVRRTGLRRQVRRIRVKPGATHRLSFNLTSHTIQKAQ